MKAEVLDTRSQRMLELLAEGASARVVARKLGYSEGTTRVYLHNLYKMIGVGNKTEAVIWYLNRVRPAEPQPQRHAHESQAACASPAAPIGMSMGAMAFAEDLYTALGAMGGFLGPYGHVWEAGLRLKGGGAPMVARRAQGRLLWRALLKGDFAYGKLLYDEGTAERLAAEAPTDGVLAACLLAMGGYSSAAQKLASQLADRRKGAGAITAREVALLRSIRDLAERPTEASVSAISDLMAESARAPLVKQIAMTALFHAHRARRDAEAAQRVAEALWAEAESLRQQLEAMGVRPLLREAGTARTGRASGSEIASARSKAALSR
jgi:DNA-binding CsgD family transcriptional regulator